MGKYTSKSLARQNKSANTSGITHLYDTVGEEEIKTALLHSSDPRVTQLLDLMFDAKTGTQPFHKLCQDVGLTAGEVIDLYKGYALSLGILRQARRAPRVMESTARAAEAREKGCSRCQGTGQLEYVNLEGEKALRECFECRGKGWNLVPGDAKSMDLFYQTLGLTGQKGPLIANQMNVNVPPEMMPLKDVITVTQKVVDE